MAILTTNAIADILEGISGLSPVLQVASIDSIQQAHSTLHKYRVQLSDGSHTHHALLLDQFNNLVLEEALVKGSIVLLEQYTLKMFNKFTYVHSFQKNSFHFFSPTCSY